LYEKLEGRTLNSDPKVILSLFWNLYRSVLIRFLTIYLTRFNST